MFGANKPFGGGTAFGSSAGGFGTSSSTFGSAGNTSFGGFGNQPQTPANSGIFGSNPTSQSSGGGLFGGGTTSFGGATPSSGFTFGSSTTGNTSGSLFGGTQQQTAGSLFGTPTTSTAFGAKTPGFGGGASTGQSGGLFGASTGTGTSLFGASSTGTTSSTGTGMFGSGGTSGSLFGAATNPGTTVKFNPPNGQDTMLKSGQSTNINTRHQCITAMKEYENKSLEELRLEDYGANRKGPQKGQTAAPTGGIFGSTPAASQASTSGFSFGGFGGGSTTQTSTAGTGMFGQSTMFSQTKPAFGTTTTTAANTGFGGFGSTNTSASTSIFGNTNANKSLFGNTTTTQAGSLFGTQTSTAGFGTGFGNTTTQTGTGLFGGNKPAFGQTTQSGLTFGQNTGGGLLSKPATSTTGFSFGTTGTSTGFGTATNTSGGLFGNKTGGFGTANTGFGTGLGTGLNTGSSLFSGQQNKPTLGLGTGFGTNTGFGAVGANAGTGFGAGTNTSTLGSGVDNSGAAEKQLQQRLMALASSPYGDSPLFSNLKQNASKREEILKPTNPAAQKAALNGSSQYKVSPRPTAKIKPKPLQSLSNGKAQLFDGLDDEDSTFGNDTFIPRRSIKKLVIKNRSPGQLSPNQSQLEEDLVAPSPIYSNGVRKSLIDRESSRDREPLNGEVISSRPVTDPSSFTHTPNNRQNFDDTIEIMNNRNKALGEPDRSHETTPSFSQGRDQDQYSERSDSPPPHPAGIVLRRAGYYTIPALEALAEIVSENGDCIVENLTVGREGYGSVFFPGETNVAGLNLDEIVHFRRKEITVYPDDDNKPSVGQGLNKRAEVTLDCVWPRDKTDQSPIKDSERLSVMRYHEKIEQITTKIGAKFIDYRPETGSWVFEVKHFSKYGLLDDSDDDDDAMDQDPKSLLLLQQQKQQQHDIQKQKIKQDIAQQKQQMASEQQKQTANEQQQIEGMDEREDGQSAAVIEDDSEMADDITRETFPVHLDMQEEMDADHVPSSHKMAQSLGLSARNMQAMKVSFFGSDEEDEEGSDRGLIKENGRPLLHGFSKAPTGVPSPLTKPHDSSVMGMFGSSLTRSTMSPAAVRAFSPQLAQDQQQVSGFLAPRVQPPPSAKSSLQPGPEHMLLPSGMTEEEQDERPRKLVGTRAQHCQRLQPFSESVTADKQNNIMDAGLFMSRSFRVGWGPNWTLVHAGKPILTQRKEEESQKKFSILSGSHAAGHHNVLTQSPFQLVMERVTIAPYASKEDKTLTGAHEDMLSTQLSHSRHSVEGGCPVFVPSPGVDALHQHAEQAAKHRDNIGGHPDACTAQHTCEVWDLCVALWGRLPGLLDDEEAEERGYAYHMARREAFSRWLTNVTKHHAQKMADLLHKGSDHISAVLSHLTCRQITEACAVAQKYGDHRLALMLAQAVGPEVSRQMMAKQLSSWQETKADRFINSERLKIFALLAGILVWNASDTVINVCEDLDWKRALAVHLWYMCMPNATVAEAMLAYDDAFMGRTSADKYTCAPRPPYMESAVDKLSLETDSEDDAFVIRDTNYHILQLYCERSHQLERTLAPTTSTCNQLDYRLSWHLGQVLQAIGYTHLSENHHATLCCNFSAQLEALGLWEWAVFVILHITDDRRREHTVRQLINRHIKLSKDEESKRKEQFIQEELHIPERWIHQAKALRAKYEKKSHDHAWHLLKSGCYYDSHHIILRHIAADAIINEEYEYLKQYLVELEPVQCSSSILDWHVGGKVFLDYIHLVQTLEEMKKGEVNSYELEKLQPEVTSLCSRVSSLQCFTAKDRLCQSEMAKKTANLLRTLLTLQNQAVNPNTRTHVPSRLLAPHIGKLPMPEDYCLQELRELTRSYMLEITT